MHTLAAWQQCRRVGYKRDLPLEHVRGLCQLYEQSRKGLHGGQLVAQLRVLAFEGPDTLVVLAGRTGLALETCQALA